MERERRTGAVLADLFENGAKESAANAGWGLVAFVCVHGADSTHDTQLSWQYRRQGRAVLS